MARNQWKRAFACASDTQWDVFKGERGWPPHSYVILFYRCQQFATVLFKKLLRENQLMNFAAKADMSRRQRKLNTACSQVQYRTGSVRDKPVIERLS